MDLFHRETRGKDTPTGRDCEFCYRTDPDFGKREPMDRLVASQLDNTAAAHLTEDGYIKHRIVELTQRLGVPVVEMELLKSA
jgi:hypothetical protein